MEFIFIARKKKEKKKARKHIKKYITYKAYYPDINMFETERGYCKAWYFEGIKEENQNSYEEQIIRMLHVPQNNGSSQICHLAGKDIIVITIQAETPEEAENMFDQYENGLSPVLMADWFRLIAHAVQFQEFEAVEEVGAVKKKRRKTKPAAKLLPKLQPYISAIRHDENGKKLKNSDPDLLDINDHYARTLLVTNFPDYIYPSLLTEILRLSDYVSSALFLSRINSEKCLEAMKNSSRELSAIREKRMEAALKDGKEEHALYQCCLMVSIYGDSICWVDEITKKIRDIATKFVCDINTLEYQQNAALKSIVPLGKCYVRCNTVLRKNQIMGLTPLSWSRYACNGISYGIDRDTNLAILYNRILTKENGFILGSNSDYIQERILHEIREILREYPEKKIAVLTLNSDLCGKLTQLYPTKTVSLPVISGDWGIDCETLTLFTLAICGHNGNMSRDKMRVLKEVLKEPVSSWEGFLTRISEKNHSMYEKLRMANEGVIPVWDTSDAEVTVYQCGGSEMRYAGRVATMMQAAFHMRHDVIYVISAEAAASTRLFTLCREKNPQKIYTWTSISADGMGIRKLYMGLSANEIECSRFLDISSHNISDRVALRSVLEFDRIQDEIIASPKTGRGILIAGDNSYCYKVSEQGERS